MKLRTLTGASSAANACCAGNADMLPFANRMLSFAKTAAQQCDCSLLQPAPIVQTAAPDL